MWGHFPHSESIVGHGGKRKKTWQRKDYLLKLLPGNKTFHKYSHFIGQSRTGGEVRPYRMPLEKITRSFVNGPNDYPYNQD